MCSGNTLALAVTGSKEMYFTRRGNIYLRPQVGLGIQTYSFSEVGSYSIASDDKDYTWTSYILPAGIGLGYNISPMLSLEMKPGVYLRTGASTDNKESLSQTAAPTDDKWGFGTIGKFSTGTTNTFSLKIRF